MEILKNNNHSVALLAKSRALPMVSEVESRVSQARFRAHCNVLVGVRFAALLSPKHTRHI